MSVVNYLKKVQLPNNVEYTVKDPTFFTGTTEEWNLLSTEEKQSYQIVNLTDDSDETLPIWTIDTENHKIVLSQYADGNDISY